MFPEARTKRYVVPVEKPVRRAVQIQEGDVIAKSVRVVEPGVVVG